MSKPKVLIVDDNDNFRESLFESPILENKFRLVEASNADDTLEIVEKQKDISCIVLDYDLGNSGNSNLKSGLEIMEYLAKTKPHIPIIMMSGITEGRGQVAIESIKNHAICFLDKPFPVKLLLEKLNSVVHDDDSEIEELIKYQQKLGSVGYVTKSQSMLAVCLSALEASQNELPVMITGETGAGKTRLAKAIHMLSNRKKFPFVELNCGNVSSDTNTFSSQLFGHVKGSFTGATQNKQGILELADKGTIFLDDITAMPLEIQKGLLQTIESKTFRKFGDDKNVIQFNSRVITASNVNLFDAIQEKILREDLKYRICGEIINIPPLRNRIEDLPYIVKSYLDESSVNTDIKVREISDEAISLLMRQPWMGNVRQLINVVIRASSHEKKDLISAQIIKSELLKEYGVEDDTSSDNNFRLDGSLEETIQNIRKKLILEALQDHKGIVSQAAKALGYQNHQGLQYWIDKLSIDVSKI